jgi:hypothetical protein
MKSAFYKKLLSGLWPFRVGVAWLGVWHKSGKSNIRFGNWICVFCCDVKVPCSIRLQELTCLGLTMASTMYSIGTLKGGYSQRSSVLPDRAFSVLISNVNLSFCTFVLWVFPARCCDPSLSFVNPWDPIKCSICFGPSLILDSTFYFLR